MVLAASQITVIDEKPVRSFSITLTTISCGQEIDDSAFENYTEATTKFGID